MSVDESSTASRPEPLDRRAARRQETKQQIVSAAWELVRENGLAGLAMRDLGERVGMKAQSVYSYYASKHEIYDAMFHEGYSAYAEIVAGDDESATEGDIDHREEARLMAHRFFDFCTSDPVRYQLLFQRTIPGFTPSEESYAVAVQVYESMTAQAESFGVTDPAAVDLWTAVLTGLTDQQISNDPGGDRWDLIVDRAVDMVLREIAPHLFDSSNTGQQP